MSSRGEDSTSWHWTPSPAPAIARFAAPAPAPVADPVWVSLERAFIHDPAHARTVVDGLDMTGRARGFIHARHQAARGDWVATVTFEVHYADGRPTPVIFRDQLVPFYALAPRTDGKSLG